ncbi:MAG: hypothetical protein WAT92_16355 [Saprospiraceae bacterium]
MKNTKTLSRFFKLFLALFMLSCQFVMKQEVATLLPYQNKSYLDLIASDHTPNEVLLPNDGPELTESCTIGSNFRSMRDDLTADSKWAMYFSTAVSKILDNTTIASFPLSEIKTRINECD